LFVLFKFREICQTPWELGNNSDPILKKSNLIQFEAMMKVAGVVQLSILLKAYLHKTKLMMVIL
jgi:hypothetical protein